MSRVHKRLDDLKMFKSHRYSQRCKSYNRKLSIKKLKM